MICVCAHAGSNGFATPTQRRTRAPNLAPCTYNDASSLSLIAFMAAKAHLNPIGITPLKTPLHCVARNESNITSRETRFGPTRVEGLSPTVRQAIENGQTPAKLTSSSTEFPMDTIALQPSDHRLRSTSQKTKCYLYPHLYLVAHDNLAVMGWADLWLLVALPRRAQ